MKSLPRKPAKQSTEELRYRRVLLKLSGEMFGGKRGTGFDFEVIREFARQVRDVSALGVALGLVVGGGNIVRGKRNAPPDMDRAAADQMGMLATVINAICLQAALESTGLETRIMTALEIRAIAEPYIKRRAERHLEKGRVLIFAGGTGHPFFTTDTAAALRASEIGAEVLIKATKVDGVYDKDPATHSDAVRYDRLSYQEVLQRKLRIMDSTAVAFCMDNAVPILVLNIGLQNNLLGAVRGQKVGTLVS